MEIGVQAEGSGSIAREWTGRVVAGSVAILHTLEFGPWNALEAVGFLLFGAEGTTKGVTDELFGGFLADTAQWGTDF